MSPDSKTHNPLVSVITCTYNRAYLLPRAIKSALNQTYQNFELLIVDDASTDNTEEVVKSFKDNRIIYHKHEKNRGEAAAQNTGFDLAKGEYYCLLDDDDELLPEALETGVKKLNELSPQGIKVVRFDSIDVETGRFSGSGIREEGYISYEDLLCDKVRGDYWLMMHKDYIGNNRYDEGFLAGGSILWLKLHRNLRSYYVPKVLYHAHRQHGGERLGSLGYSLKYISRLTFTRKASLQEYGEDMKSLCPKRYQQQLAELGFYEILNDEKSAGRRTLCESFKYGFSFKYRILYLSSFILNKNQIRALYMVYIRFLHIKQAVVSILIAVRKLSYSDKAI